jgi:uncharacterized protein
MDELVSIGGPQFDAAALAAKQARLIDGLRALGRVLVAYSGGTDSAYLIWAAREALGDAAVAVTADSPSVPRTHMREAIELARRIGIRHEIIATHEFANPAYAANNADRCFHCKDELFRSMETLAARYPGQTIVYGVNADDLGDFRPGQKAAQQHHVHAPLVEAGLTKAEIRALSRQANLPTWNRPAAACLSSRVAYGTAVTVDNIRQIELAEETLKELGFRHFRVRYHDGPLARVEVDRAEFGHALHIELLEEITRRLKALGFKYVTLDLEGYRQGSMNEVLGLEKK